MNNGTIYSNLSLGVRFDVINETDSSDLSDPPLIEEEIYDVPVHVIVLLSICYGSISIAAVMGNGLVMWVIATSRRMKSVTNYYIANLALADIVIGMFSIPFEVTVYGSKLNVSYNLLFIYFFFLLV